MGNKLIKFPVLAAHGGPVPANRDKACAAADEPSCPRLLPEVLFSVQPLMDGVICMVMTTATAAPRNHDVITIDERSMDVRDRTLTGPPGFFDSTIIAAVTARGNLSGETLGPNGSWCIMLAANTPCFYRSLLVNATMQMSQAQSGLLVAREC